MTIAILRPIVKDDLLVKNIKHLIYQINQKSKVIWDHKKTGDCTDIQNYYYQVQLLVDLMGQQYLQNCSLSELLKTETEIEIKAPLALCLIS